jgi:hypothetical protein
MKRLVIESWGLLLYFEWIMRFQGFKRLHQVVGQERSIPRIDAEISSQELCHAIDLACVCYFKRVLCLQRSAATTLLLRRHGWIAEMVIGAKLVPFESHAWVEIDGCVVNDKPYMTELYEVLERC